MAQESQKEDALSAEDDVGDKSYGKGDQADSKSVASSRSIEEEDEDEVSQLRVGMKSLSDFLQLILRRLKKFINHVLVFSSLR